jgi:hypothetical protein
MSEKPNPEETVRAEAPIHALIQPAAEIAEGGSAGIWHAFPTTPDLFHAALEVIGQGDARSKDFGVCKYRTPVPGLARRLPAFPDFNELNYLAVRIKEMLPRRKPLFTALMETGNEYSIRDIINLTENLDCFDLQPAYNARQYGEFLMDDNGDRFAEIFAALENSSLPSAREFAEYAKEIEKFVDREKYGKAAAIAEHGVFVHSGYLTKTAADFARLYNGSHDIPRQCRVFPDFAPRSVLGQLDKNKTALTDSGEPQPVHKGAGGHEL